MYTYHYHALKQVSILKAISIDGIVTFSHPIKTMEDYDLLKKAIGETKDGDTVIGPENLVVHNLSLLHTDLS